MFIFYFLLNEEVRKFWREKKRKNRLKTSTEKGLNLVNLVIGKDEDYDETLDETFETSDKEENKKLGPTNSYKKDKKKVEKVKTTILPLSANRNTDRQASKQSHNEVGDERERFFIEPQEWEKNRTRRHSVVDIPANAQEKITVL